MTGDRVRRMYILSAQRDMDAEGAGERYAAYLRDNEERFPKGALALARSEWYFNFFDHRCPHDGWLEQMAIEEPSSGARHQIRTVRMTLRLLGAYHDGYIELHYPRVFRYRLDNSVLSGGHGEWRYDEFRVTSEGHLEHEIEWVGGGSGPSWLIVASDVEHRWIPR
jgi:hypothetical protein